MKDMKKRLDQIEVIAKQPITTPLVSNCSCGKTEDELLERLTKLASLKEKGFLSEEEFTAAKKKLLMG